MAIGGGHERAAGLATGHGQAEIEDDIGLAQPVWLILARALPPIASSMSVMMIPVLGVVSGAWWLNEKLHWQDGAAIVLVLVAIATVMLPARRSAQPVEPA